MSGKRQPTAEELAVIDETLRRLREHFHEWPHYEGRERDLLEFALYEGCGGDCCGAIMAEAAPFALGRELVDKHDFEWQMLQQGETWHYGVTHPRLDEPVDLQSLEDGRWDEQRDDYDEPPVPGESTINSFDLLTRKAGTWRRVAR